MSAENISQTGYIPQMPISEKNHSIELTSDFSLPDYQPEIRRLLSTRVNVLPPSEYVGNDSAEFSGEIIYRILYTGNDGSLYSASVSDSYSIDAPIEYSSKNVSPNDVLPLISVYPESVISRVLGPRKLNFRCKLHSNIEILSPAVCYPHSNGSISSESVQNLLASSPLRKVKKLDTDAVPLSDFITLDSPAESARIVDCSSSVFITECIPVQEKLNCRGEVLLKLLYCNDSESELPLTITRKIPFSCFIDDTELDASFECRASAYVSDEKLDIEENGINCELLLHVYVEAQKNDQLSYVKDSYSTERHCECNYQSITLPVSVKCANGNLSQSESVRLSDLKLSPDAKIIDINGTASARELSIENGKIIIKGDCAYTIIYHLNDEYGAHDTSFPFKYELDCKNIPVSENEHPRWIADVSVISSRARTDAESLFVDSELALSMRVCSSESVETLAEINFGDEIENRSSEIVICYPEKSDTLWSIAKRYARSPESIKQKNAISENDQSFKKKYLMI